MDLDNEIFVKFVFVFEFETMENIGILHTEYPKFLYSLDTKQIQWLEKIVCDDDNEESDLKLHYFELTQNFINQNKNNILLKNDDTTIHIK